MGRSTLWDWKTKTWDLTRDHNEDLDQDRIKNDRAEVKIHKIVQVGRSLYEHGKSRRTDEISKFSKSRREELDDIRDHSKKFGRSRMQIGRAD
ncbi:unnamed protein product [Microthlaspi erraticum]|uniref:Uncharacterized protein n=1 Tax=Microthlaspi erraticum TaxID=1685480 RepID=A0A6D2K0L6_9BRAS|nr:unnamed protein product [Microthlaspi erraticum]